MNITPMFGVLQSLVLLLLCMTCACACLDHLMTFAALPDDANFSLLYQVEGPQFNSQVPDFVLLPTSVHQVQRVLQCAFEIGRQVVVKGGGHSFAGYSSMASRGLPKEEVFVISFAKMTQVTWAGNSSVTVQAGSRWRDVYQAFREHGGLWVVTGGLCPSVGVVGYSLGGGVGPVSKQYGLAADNIESITMVTFDGQRVVSANAEQNAELFWALRGSGGGNFGVIVDLTFKVHSATRYYTWGTIAFAGLSNVEVSSTLQMLGKVSKDFPRSLNIDPVLSAGGQLEFWVVYQGPRAELDALTEQFDLLNGLNAKAEYHEFDCFWEMIADYAEHHGYSEFDSDAGLLKSCFVDEVTPDLADFIAASANGELMLPADACDIHLLDFGGAVSDLPNNATAFFWRESQYMMYASCGYDYHNTTDFERIKLMTSLWFEKAQTWCKGSYVNFIDPFLPNWAQMYYGDNLPGLSAVQKQWNPLSFSTLRFHQSIPDNIRTS